MSAPIARAKSHQPLSEKGPATSAVQKPFRTVTLRGYSVLQAELRNATKAIKLSKQMRTSTLHHVNPLMRRGGSASYARRAIQRPPNLPRLYTTKQTARQNVFFWGSAITLFTIGASIGYYWPQQKPVLDEETFSPYVLLSREPVSSTASIFTLLPRHSANAASTKEDPYDELWFESLWSVQAKQPQLQIAREYTPLPPSVIPTAQPTNHHALRMLIRQERNGEMSSYLHKLPVGTDIELRGPNKQLAIDTGVESVIFCAGGTGIAPALQCAYVLLSSYDVDQLPRMHILWANRRREDCIGGVSDTRGTKSIWQWFSRSSPASSTEPAQASALIKELESLKSLFGGRLTVDYFVDEEESFIGTKELKSSLVPSTTVINSNTVVKSKHLVLVSGPDGFISHLAGPKGIRNGVEVQGTLGGILKNLVQEENCIVWKL